MAKKKTSASKTAKAAPKKTARKKTSTTAGKTATKSKKKRQAKTAARPAARKKSKPAAKSAKPAGKRARPAAKRTAKPKRRATAKSQAPAEKRGAVDAYVSKLNDWRRDCVAGLRKMIKKSAPESTESVKGSQPVYEHHGPFAWIKAHAKHVNLGFWRGKELPDPRRLLRGTGEKMRHIKLSNLKDAGKKELQEFVRLAAQLNELKGNPARPKKSKSKSK
ncbi:MAG: hypothetical protein DWQ37_04765 [Planctomycetota bacterium]|nr:MAG: hypothetical protein DWQ37_04765 [Planctomycetota bacterium]